MIPREEWGATGGRGRRVPGAKAFVVVHHTSSPDVPCGATLGTEIEAVRSIERHHVDTNGWAGIGYNFLGSQTGRTFEGRGWGREGAHAPGYNSKSLGYVFIIDGDVHEPTPAAVEAFKAWCMAGITGGHLTPDFTILGHRDVRATDCPGSKVYAMLSELWP